MKVKPFDRAVLKTFSVFVAVISSIIGIFAIAISIDDQCKWIWLLVWVVILLIAYLVILARANLRKEAHFKINGTRINVIIGDIFTFNDGLKVIPVNEYFDTQVDNVVIAESSLHGKYLLHYCKDISQFEKLVLSRLNPIDINKERTVANHKNRYELGSIVENDGYLLTAFTKFNNKNEAYLFGKDYLYFWGSFWTNLDEIYAGRSVYIPLFGSGITRFKDYTPSNQELLENILLIMRKTGFRNKYCDKSINIVIYEGNAKDIDFYHLKERVGD